MRKKRKYTSSTIYLVNNSFKNLIVKEDRYPNTNFRRILEFCCEIKYSENALPLVVFDYILKELKND